MSFSMLPAMLGIQLLLIWLAALRASRLNSLPAGGLTFVAITLSVIGGWGIISGYLAYNNVYLQKSFLSSWPAFWVTFITPMIIMVPATISVSVRNTIRAIIDITPLHWIVLFEAARILAIGGIVKAINGEFSAYYAIYIGVPDMIYGASGLLLAYFLVGKMTGQFTAIVWNIIGIIIILPFGTVLLQMGLEGPWHLFKETPTIVTIFEFPMALAPTLVVPMFIVVNILVTIRLVERFSADKSPE